ncbi:hypothetical protein MLP_52990 [Microlunatus phosphovorus NM-1]|uniref:TetR family transcriptional regulator n=1 Tax=Microlunatus phosphovorus (strain ATCC 700054 / DSM 10555 / JCM 9379 / NBRC 101784 / NCIMB 13414 / VKM Ac-1990 / NM-1) TaxID=1032480 RepID=F5XIS5_MICPN|nr:hypothetical protein MLP_52990 [Microlunatus phosphovorus NM-1]
MPHFRGHCGHGQRSDDGEVACRPRHGAARRRYDDIIATSTEGAELTARVADTMAATLRDDAALHRLWYDLRNQSLFEDGFRDTIIRIDDLLQQMVWTIVLRYAELMGRAPAVAPEFAYALVDGLFQNELIRFLRGDPEALDRLRRDCVTLLSNVA